MSAASSYETVAMAGNLHTILDTGDLLDLTKKQLLKVYSARMAKPGSVGRPIYNKLMVVPQKRCSLCAQRDVSTLDHYLPESHHSLLVVVPVNLVPSCKDCNFNKLNVNPTTRECRQEGSCEQSCPNSDSAPKFLESCTLHCCGCIDVVLPRRLSTYTRRTFK